MKNKICFPMYWTIKEIINKYNELLGPLDLTYTQYLVMYVLWEDKQIEMKELCIKVCLDSNTLSPVINRLIKKGYLTKYKSEKDKRVIIIELLENGEKIKEAARKVHDEIYGMVDLTDEEKSSLIKILAKIQNQLSKKTKE